MLISPNDPLAMLNYAQECRRLGIPYAYDPSQQIARLSGEDLAASIPGAAYLLCNEYELGMIQKKTGWSLDEIRGEVGVLINTVGKDGSLIYVDERVVRDSARAPGRTRSTRPAPAMPIAAGCLRRCWPGCRGKCAAASAPCAGPMRSNIPAPPRTPSRWPS